MRNKHLVPITAALIIFIDQLTKFLLIGAHIRIIEGFFLLNYVTNTGAGFGILKGSTWLLIFFSIFVIGLIIFYLDKVPKTKYYTIAMGLILGGTIGNLIDRIFRGHVVDFIDLTFWPVFNIADSAITIGAIMLIFSNIRKK